MTGPELLLDVRGLGVDFRSRGRVVHAVRDCTLQVRRGEVVALVGESGSGKSTLARTVAGIGTPTAGRIEFRQRDLARVPAAECRALRRRIQMVFQDPDASLNPLHRIGTIIGEPLVVRGGQSRAAIAGRVGELLELVRLDAALLDRRPRELSGGQKQRVAIARALASEPELLIADEALSALDVSTQAAIAALFEDLRRRLGITLLFISHDLATVRQLATRVAVMHMGEIVEAGPVADVLERPSHPYTRLLVAATPDTSRRTLDFALVDAIDRLPQVPDVAGACSYRTRCVRRAQVCERAPALEPVAAGREQQARCHFRSEAGTSGPAGGRHDA